MKTKETNFVGIRKTRKFHSDGEQMRNGSGQQGEAANEVKMSRSEKIKANMNTGNKIYGKHIRQFLH